MTLSTAGNSQSGKRTSYFGTKVSVAFDDGKEYPGVIVGRNENGQWITRFEDGTEDTCADPSNDIDYKILVHD